MKKILILVLIMCISISIFTACSNNTEVDNEQTDQEASEQSVEETNNTKDFNTGVKITENEISFKDASGDDMTLQKNPQKVICLYNSYLDLWYEAGGEVIGRVKTRSKVPEAAKNAEIVGKMSSPNVEKIIALQPDLVILRPEMRGQDEIIPILKQNNIPYLSVEYDNFDQYLKTLRIFTALNDREDLYKEKGLDVKEEIDEIISKVPDENNPSVLLLFASSRSVKAKFGNSFCGDMLKDLKTKNIAYDAQLSEEEMEVFSMEKVIERDPDYILVQTMGDVEEVKERMKDEVEANPAWSALTAVKEGRYIYLPKDLYLYKPNARYAEAYRGLAEILYPEIFSK